eukprot:COSAG01_NODE_2830_length_6998_cov_17.705754_1_plen_86_part_00
MLTRGRALGAVIVRACVVVFAWAGSLAWLCVDERVQIGDGPLAMPEVVLGAAVCGVTELAQVRQKSETVATAQIYSHHSALYVSQ